jgi:hypothetical protein
MTRIKTPDEFHVMDIIEAKYKVSLFARTIDGTHLLSQYSPFLINVSWPEETTRPAFYDMTVAKNERTIPVFSGRKMTLDEVLRVFGRYCKVKSVEEQQLRLF